MSVDEAEFADWYAGLHPRLVNSLLVISGDADGAADAADEAFARALARWSRVGGMANRDGWAYRVAVNVLRRRARRSARERHVLQASRPAPDVPAPADDVWALVRRLPARQRQAVVLRYLADLDEAGIARVMGVARSTVSSALTQARRQLAGMVAADEERDPG